MALPTWNLWNFLPPGLIKLIILTIKEIYINQEELDLVLLFRVIASGSNGNCSVLRADSEVLLIDAGISRKRIVQGLKDLEIDPGEVKYILITHAHSDHINSLAILEGDALMEFRVVATRETLQEIGYLSRNDPRFEKVAKKGIAIDFNKPFTTDKFIIRAFPVNHDIAGAACFSIENIKTEFKLSYVTDSSKLATSFAEELEKSDIIAIESNHDVQMLDHSRRPAYLKARIKQTHLSNKNTLQYLENVITERTRVVFLAHLSGECNTPDLVANKIDGLRKYLKDKKDLSFDWIICRRDASSSILEFDGKVVKISEGMSNHSYVPGEQSSYLDHQDKIPFSQYKELRTSDKITMPKGNKTKTIKGKTTKKKSIDVEEYF